MADLTTLSAHFAFGENWRAYSRLIDEERIEQATKDLSRMMGGRLDGLSFLDIGCGSGLHAIAALRLGAREVVGVDLDPVSVATAVESLERFVPGAPWRIQELSVFNLEAAGLPCFDVVYSWGVLHHTGDMWRAIASASRCVAPGGRLALALYRRTVLCGLWRREKKWYASATPDAQQRAQRLYLGLLRLGCLATGRSFKEFVQRYNTKRGMDYLHDLHDWLGGYPYQSVGARFLKRRLSRMGFGIEVERSRGLQLGLLGSGCDEFTFRRTR